MNRHYKLFTFLLISGLVAIDDTESWSSISLETKMPYFSKVKIEQSLRLKNEAQNFKQTFTEVSLYYKFNDYITFNVPYRYAIFENKIKSRISFGSAFKYKKKDLTIRYRTKLENSKELNKEVEKNFPGARISVHPSNLSGGSESELSWLMTRPPHLVSTGQGQGY